MARPASSGVDDGSPLSTIRNAHAATNGATVTTVAAAHAAADVFTIGSRSSLCPGVERSTAASGSTSPRGRPPFSSAAASGRPSSDRSTIVSSGATWGAGHRWRTGVRPKGSTATRWWREGDIRPGNRYTGGRRGGARRLRRRSSSRPSTAAMMHPQLSIHGESSETASISITGSIEPLP